MVIQSVAPARTGDMKGRGQALVGGARARGWASRASFVRRGLRLEIPGSRNPQLFVWGLHFKRAFEPFYADVEVISTFFSLTELRVRKNTTPSRVFVLRNRHILELGSWDGM